MVQEEHTGEVKHCFNCKGLIASNGSDYDHTFPAEFRCYIGHWDSKNLNDIEFAVREINYRVNNCEEWVLEE